MALRHWSCNESGLESIVCVSCMYVCLAIVYISFILASPHRLQHSGIKLGDFLALKM